VPRKLRVEYPGAIYHVINRGDRREPILRDDADRTLFVAALGECCGKTDWQVHAWCLMINHFHLVVETPKANLVAGMKWFLGTYTARFCAEDRHESGEQKAREIVSAELKRTGWTEEDLNRRRKGDTKKVRIAQRLRAETTMTLKWIADELQMSAWTHVSNLLSRQRRKRQ